ncbi:MAG: kynureninase, partial [Bacteroidia bacterium]|nr:kynureninase [Bacteroidia bacterium]
MQFFNTEAFASEMDSKDKLASFREKFYIPLHEGKQMVYFTGNSLGLQPQSALQAIQDELNNWKDLGVEGHFKGSKPWMHYHKFLNEKAAEIVGAKPSEVVIMNNLTVNLHLMMVSFYRPEGKRYKILMESGAFPSDQYAMESQAKFHGYDYEDAVVEISPREGEDTLRTEDILAKIEELGDSLALCMFSGVQYYTGQYFNIPEITKAGKKVGAVVGFDLAHAAGNVRLKLHEWDVDFAVWCGYKYL